jgi:Protein of unknown function (DUF2937)
VLRDLWTATFAVLGAAVFSQAPNFLNQYRQALAHRLDEVINLGRDLRVKAPADSGGLQMLLGREAELRAAHAAVMDAHPLTRPFAATYHMDMSVLNVTMDRFVPSVPLTAEALAYAGLGLLAGILVARLPLALWRRFGPSRRRTFNA